jgi:hypothetical protein
MPFEMRAKPRAIDVQFWLNGTEVDLSGLSLVLNLIEVQKFSVLTINLGHEMASHPSRTKNYLDKTDFADSHGSSQLGLN